MFFFPVLVVLVFRRVVWVGGLWLVRSWWFSVGVLIFRWIAGWGSRLRVSFRRLPGSRLLEAAASAVGTVWYELNRSAGPIRAERVGLGYRGGRVLLLLDAEVDVGGVRLGTRGLGMSVSLDTARPDPRFQLEGLEVGFNRPPVEILGSLINISPPPPGYSLAVGGAVTADFRAAHLQAVGFYAHPVTGSTPSFFVYGGIGSKNGVGNSIVKVKEGRIGFGYNSSVRAPGIGDVGTFPFLVMLDSASARDPLELLGDLLKPHGPAPAWVSPSAGSVWLAGGLAGTLFEFADWRAVALLEFGPDFRNFSVNLLGHLSASFPKQGSPFARVELDAHAGYSSVEDLLQMTAVLGPGCFLVSPSCKVSGGSALRMWFGGSAHAGDFVYTVGGYHPALAVPGHYPSVNRIAVDWPVIPGHLRISGSYYFALTPSVLMLGGRIDVSVDFVVTAGLSASVDAIVGWQPFQFDVGVDVNAWVDLGWPFGRVHGGAHVQVWGSPTGGRVTIRTPFKDFDVPFGAGREPARPATWDDFRRNMLPGDSDILRARPLSGLLPEVKGDQGPGAAWIASAGDFSLQIRSAIPMTRISAVGRTEKIFEKPESWTVGQESPGLCIRPLAVAVSSELKLSISRDGQPLDPAGQDKWQFSSVSEKVPGALWSVPPPDPARDPFAAVDQVVGVRITPPSNAKLAPVDIAPRGIALVGRSTTAKLPVQSGPSPDPAPRFSAGAKHLVSEKIATPDIAAARSGLYSALPAGIRPADSDSPLKQYASWSAEYLSADPMTVTV
ncbi:DUF6603 domain-containing protein [Streptomyces murinus]|uniref:DUF6603 domain-containing protein n=1 Tax=Streptomyces murinus TaxID=33900 RepID=UPI003F488E09